MLNNYLPYADMQQHIHQELVRLQKELLQRRAGHHADEVERLEKKIDRLQVELQVLRQHREDAV